MGSHDQALAFDDEAVVCRGEPVLTLGLGSKSMKFRLLRITYVLGALGATMLAVGASVRGF